MNTNPNAKRVLCFGDSLTYGRIPDEKRYSITQRFTGIIQQVLGNDYDIIEEGLIGRMLYGENKFFPGREGNLHFGPIVGSHLPLDIIVVILGTNDSNNKNNISSEGQIHRYIDHYREQINRWCNSIGSEIPKLLLVSPPNIKEEYAGEKFYNANQKIKLIQDAYKTYSHNNKIPLLETHTYIQPSTIDGIHLDEENNKKLGILLAEKIKEII